MTRGFHRTLLISSLVAGVGSFGLELVKTLIVFAAVHGVTIPVPDRQIMIVICIIVIAFAMGGLLVIHLVRGRRSD